MQELDRTRAAGASLFGSNDNGHGNPIDFDFISGFDTQVEFSAWAMVDGYATVFDEPMAMACRHTKEILQDGR
jgi:hypothetical protein